MSGGPLDKEKLEKLTEIFFSRGLPLYFKQELDHSVWVQTGGEPIELSKELVAKVIDIASGKLLNRLTSEFVETFIEELGKQVEADYKGKGAKRDRNVPGKGPSPQQFSGLGAGTPPRTAKELYDGLLNYRHTKLKGFNFKDKDLEEHAKNVAKKAKQIKEDLELDDHHIAGLATIALYDIVFLCDNSGSMNIGHRIRTLKKTLHAVSDLATLLEPRGISVRFLNCETDTDGQFDDLANWDTIDDRIREVDFEGGTLLGSMLQEKIIYPFVLKGDRVEEKRPLLAVVITDGEPSEDDIPVKDVITDFKGYPDIVDLGPGATVFIMFRVGNSSEAEDFLNNLAEDDDLKGMLYCAGYNLEDVKDAFEKRLDMEPKTKENRYKRKLLEEFMVALETQTTESTTGS